MGPLLGFCLGINGTFVGTLPMQTDLLKGELRHGWLGVPEVFTPYDFLGAALGAYFIYQGATKQCNPLVNVGLGSVMLFIHTQRFFYAPRTKDGLIKLLKALDVKEEDIKGAL